MTSLNSMRAMVLQQVRQDLCLQEMAMPHPQAHEVLLRVEACAVCRTDLHIVDGELPVPRLPVTPGHEIVGRVLRVGSGVRAFQVGDRVGVPWLAHTCGECAYCGTGRENLCDRPLFTGHGRDGGFATHVVAEAAYCFALDASANPVELAPLLCAGLIGWRTWQMAGPTALDIGLYGFGAAAHIVCQVAAHQGRRVHAFTRPGDDDAQEHARSLGAIWAGSVQDAAASSLDAALIFAPAGELVPLALQAVRKGGRVVCGGIHMSDIPAFPYRWLWGERQVMSVANLTRADGLAFLKAVSRVPLQVTTTRYRLEQANEALADLRDGRVLGAAVIVP